MKGIIRYWLIDVNKIRKIITDINSTLSICKLGTSIKDEMATNCNKILTLLNKGKT